MTDPSPDHSSRTRRLAIALGVAVVLMATGCAQRYTDYGAFLQAHPPAVSASEYRLSPPDRILVQSLLVSEVDGHDEVIRPDGMISLPLLGQVFVADKTPKQVSDELQRRARRYYEDADVNVQVLDYASKKLFVFGEVQTAGPFPYTGTNTVLGTLARAQPNRIADVSHVQILRPSPDGTMRHRMTIDLDQMVQGGDTSLNAMLHEGDIVFVPPTALARVGLALQQVLLPIQPAAATFRGADTISDSSTGGTYRGGNRR